jgi:hypothetical protein
MRRDAQSRPALRIVRADEARSHVASHAPASARCKHECCPGCGTALCKHCGKRDCRLVMVGGFCNAHRDEATRRPARVTPEHEPLARVMSREVWGECVLVVEDVSERELARRGGQ